MIILLTICLLPLRASAADLVFTGSLRFLRPEFLTIRLADGRVISARLPRSPDLAADAISAKYRTADQVEMTCRHIQAYWDKTVGRYHSLEVIRLRFIGPPSPAQVARVVASFSWEDGDNLLKTSAIAPPAPPPPAPAPQGLDRIRDINLGRAANMPNFTADETATRSLRRSGSTRWRQVDTVKSEITFLGNQGGRQNIRINGKLYRKAEGGWIPGVNWGLGFGTELKPLFSRDCGNSFTFDGVQELRGRQVLSFGFSAPPDGCFGPGTINYTQYDAARTGRILVDEPAGNVIQLESATQGTPIEFSGEHRATLLWDYVRIGDASHLLPVGADYCDTFSSGDQWHIAVEYKNHRHFEASTDVTFQEAPGPPR
jgi:hypothetical protein